MSKSQVIKILCFFISPILFLCFIEGVFRVTGINENYRRMSPSILIEEDLEFLHRVRSNLDFEIPYYLTLEEIGVRKIPLQGVRVVTNSFGLRERSDLPFKKPSNELRIFCAGDSVTFGWGSHYEDTYPQLLEQLLKEATSKQINAINVGQPGFSSYQLFLYYHKFLSTFEPDIVVVAIGHNDHHLGIQGYTSAKQKVLSHTEGIGRLKMRLRRFDTFLLFDRVISRIIGKVKSMFIKNIADEYTQPGSIDEYRNTLELLIRAIHESGAYCILMTEPRVSHEPITDTYNETLMNVARTMNVPMIDLVPIFDAEMDKLVNLGEERKPPNAIFWDDIHPTPAGNKLMAQAVTDLIIRNKIIEKITEVKDWVRSD